MNFVPCVYAPVRVWSPSYAAVSVVMRLEKRVRTKKRVAYVCYFARDAARAIEGGFWTLADAVGLVSGVTHKVTREGPLAGRTFGLRVNKPLI